MSSLSTFSKKLASMRLNRVSNSPQKTRSTLSPLKTRFASGDDINNLFDESELKMPASHQSSRPASSGISDTGPYEQTASMSDHNTGLAFNYPNVPSLYELMQDNPRVFYIPSNLRDVPVHLLRFPFNFFKSDIKPHVQCTQTIESFNYFAVYESNENCS